MWNGSRPGASAFNASGSSEKLAPRFCISTPVARQHARPSRIPNRATGCRRRRGRRRRRRPSRPCRLRHSGAGQCAALRRSISARFAVEKPGVEVALDRLLDAIGIGHDAVAHARRRAWSPRSARARDRSSRPSGTRRRSNSARMINEARPLRRRRRVEHGAGLERDRQRLGERSPGSVRGPRASPGCRCDRDRRRSRAPTSPR